MDRHPDIPDRFFVAIGGNATHPPGIIGTPEEQGAIAHVTGRALLPLMELNNELVITHGNGPVVGKILVRQTLARNRVTPMTMDICVAHSQGGIAYLLMQALENTLREAGNPRYVVCLLTQVEVDPDDPAFQNPMKPIGCFYTEEEAQELKNQLGWEMRRIRTEAGGMLFPRWNRSISQTSPSSGRLSKEAPSASLEVEAEFLLCVAREERARVSRQLSTKTLPRR